MNFLNSRLRRLEERISGGGPCPECGRSPRNRAEAQRIVLVDGEDAEPEPAELETCPECGLPEVIVLRLVEEGWE
jgi:hypothetical protein